MTDRKFNLHNGKSGAAITVRVASRASRSEISEILDDGTLKIRLAGQKTGEQSNRALIEFLAKVLTVDPSQIEIVAGLSGNDKLITITGLDSDSVQERVMKNLS